MSGVDSDPDSDVDIASPRDANSSPNLQKPRAKSPTDLRSAIDSAAGFNTKTAKTVTNLLADQGVTSMDLVRDLTNKDAEALGVGQPLGIAITLRRLVATNDGGGGCLVGLTPPVEPQAPQWAPIDITCEDQVSHTHSAPAATKTKMTYRQAITNMGRALGGSPMTPTEQPAPELVDALQANQRTPGHLKFIELGGKCATPSHYRSHRDDSSSSQLTVSNGVLATAPKKSTFITSAAQALQHIHGIFLVWAALGVATLQDERRYGDALIFVEQRHGINTMLKYDRAHRLSADKASAMGSPPSWSLDRDLLDMVKDATKQIADTKDKGKSGGKGGWRPPCHYGKKSSCPRMDCTFYHQPEGPPPSQSMGKGQGKGGKSKGSQNQSGNGWPALA